MGLVEVRDQQLVSKKDKTVAWVSDDAKARFNKEGKAAIASQFNKA